ncbi:hypothetical protein KY327_02000 [Candidatus Woesearchaeota archaeon]|nr:hypothetical protein [Candidatus Woesearchaeota archaeon]
MSERDPERLKWLLDQAYRAISEEAGLIQDELVRGGDLEYTVRSANRGVRDGVSGQVWHFKEVLNSYLERCWIPGEEDEGVRAARKYLSADLPPALPPEYWTGEGLRRLQGLEEEREAFVRRFGVAPEGYRDVDLRLARVQTAYLDKGSKLVLSTPFLNLLYRLPFDGS